MYFPQLVLYSLFFVVLKTNMSGGLGQIYFSGKFSMSDGMTSACGLLCLQCLECEELRAHRLNQKCYVCVAYMRCSFLCAVLLPMAGWLCPLRCPDHWLGSGEKINKSVVVEPHFAYACAPVAFAIVTMISCKRGGSSNAVKFVCLRTWVME